MLLKFVLTSLHRLWYGLGMTHRDCSHEATPKARAACRHLREELTRLKATPYAWNLEVLLEDSRGVWRSARFMRADDDYYARVQPGAVARGEYAIVTRSGETFTVSPDRVRFV